MPAPHADQWQVDGQNAVVLASFAGVLPPMTGGICGVNERRPEG
jgi:hypothetical protein